MTFVFIFVAVVVAVGLTGWFLSAPVYRGPVTDHFNGKFFFYPDHQSAKGFSSLLKWFATRKQGPWSKTEHRFTASSPPSRITDHLRITFVNHSTFLIQFGGINVLTDPVWSERVSPFSWIGPARMRPPGIMWEDLPPIHLVLLSHNHYDHLDIGTIRRLNQQHKPLFVAPLGVKAFLSQLQVSDCIEFDWWEGKEVFADVNITCLPALHFSGRGMFDRDRTLWAGFFLRTKFGNIYFAGDTGYNSTLFKTIGERCSPIDVSLIPIGAYKPEWFMSPIHCSPDEAVQIHCDVKSRTSIASHFGSFPLADDSQVDPVEDLSMALTKMNIKGSFIALEEGRRFELEKPQL